MIRTILAAALSVVALAPVAANGQTTPDGITVNSRGLVILSTLDTCAVEDGSTGPLPCVWNVGPGKGDGLSYWIGKRGAIHYVWDEDPTDKRGTRWIGRRMVERTHTSNRCVVTDTDAGPLVTCPNGRRVLG